MGYPVSPLPHFDALFWGGSFNRRPWFLATKPWMITVLYSKTVCSHLESYPLGPRVWQNCDSNSAVIKPTCIKLSVEAHKLYSLFTGQAQGNIVSAVVKVDKFLSALSTVICVAQHKYVDRATNIKASAPCRRSLAYVLYSPVVK